MKVHASIDEYIASYPQEIQVILKKIRHTIKEAAPEAKEKIGYGIPTFTFHGNLVHFGGYKTHIGFYPGPEAIEVFRKDLEGYELSKGTVRFPLDQPIPYPLIKKLTAYRVKRSLEKKK